MMRYRFFDKIKRVEIGREIVAIKNVTDSEDYFEEHFVRNPVMPGALQIEAIAQVCGALIQISSDYRKASILMMVEKIKFRKMVHPGDQLWITCTVVSDHEDSAFFDAVIRVEGEVVTSGQIAVGKLDAYASVVSADTQTLLKGIYHFALIGAEILPPQHPSS